MLIGKADGLMTLPKTDMILKLDRKEVFPHRAYFVGIGI